MTLREMFDRAVERYPELEAIVDGSKRYTYEAWNNRVNRLAAGLREMGVRKGDRVVIVLPNSEAAATTYWALQKLGAVATPINFRWAPEEIAYCVDDAEAQAIVFGTESRESVLDALERHGKAKSVIQIYVGEDRPEGVPDLEEIISSAPALSAENYSSLSGQDYNVMLYTSGTTGRPKGVPRTHQSDYMATVAHLIQLHWSLHERTLGVMPIYHTMGLHTLLGIVFVNGLFVAQGRFDAHRALELIQREKITALYLVPTLFHEIITHPEFETFDISSVQKIAYAGAPMGESLTRACVVKFHPQVFVNHYGSTEVYTHSICERVREKPGCAGRAAFHAHLRVVTADRDRRVSPDEVVPPGHIGEIIVRSDEAFGGYWNRPEATEKALRDGWYFTGDLGYIDDEGDLYVVGRVDDMIISGGENIHPLEVEEVLSKHSEVKEVVVAGIPDDRWGQIVAAFVVPRSLDFPADRLEGLAHELDRLCRESPELANFKRPRKYVFVKEVPKSPVGKILRRKLQAGEFEALGAVDLPVQK